MSLLYFVSFLSFYLCCVCFVSFFLSLLLSLSAFSFSHCFPLFLSFYRSFRLFISTTPKYFVRLSLLIFFLLFFINTTPQGFFFLSFVYSFFHSLNIKANKSVVVIKDYKHSCHCFSLFLSFFFVSIFLSIFLSFLLYPVFFFNTTIQYFVLSLLFSFSIHMS